MYKKTRRKSHKRRVGGAAAAENGTHEKWPAPCKQNMTFDECELAIVRAAVDELEHAQLANKTTNGPEIARIMEIVEEFIRKNRVILYGGAAINGILPKHAQFYDYKAGDIPDYDFFSPTAMKDAIALTDIYYAAGYKDVEAKAGVHHGTYKVYVSQIPVADCTQQDPVIFGESWKESIVIDGMHYSSANWLRMGAYIELSRPLGDVSRYEKVVKRLALLNKYHPMEAGMDCFKMEFQRKMDEFNEADSERIFRIVRDTFINEEVVFFGSYAVSLYGQYMPARERKQTKKAVDFDVCSENIAKTARVVVEQLQQNGFKSARVVEHPALGEILPPHNEIRIGKHETLAFIFEPAECINYNILDGSAAAAEEGAKIRVATIDTILRFYLAFMYTRRPYFDKNRLFCMANFLFRVQEKNRLVQKGLLKRFSLDCVGKQSTLENIRAEKAEKYKKLKGHKEDPEYYQWFLKYQPGEVAPEEHAQILRAAAAAAAAHAVVAAPPAAAKTRRKRRKAARRRGKWGRTLSSVGYRF